MPMKKPFQCPRCGYETKYSNCIEDHLYKRKKPCKTIISDIVLTEDVKKKVIGRRYDGGNEASSQHVIQYNNNNNTNQTIIINNNITSVDVFERLMSYLRHQNQNLIPLEDTVSFKFENMNQSLSYNDMYNMLHDVANINGNINEFNVIYNDEEHVFKIYDKDNDDSCKRKWFEVDIVSGIKMIVMRLKEYCWDLYEQSLLRSIEVHKHTDMISKLQEYYKFIATTHQEPFVKDKNNNHVLFSPDDDEYYKGYNFQSDIAKKYYEMFSKIRDDINETYRTNLHAIIFSRIKEAHVKNIITLNSKLVDLFGCTMIA